MRTRILGLRRLSMCVLNVRSRPNLRANGQSNPGDGLLVNRWPMNDASEPSHIQVLWGKSSDVHRMQSVPKRLPFASQLRFWGRGRALA